MLELVSSEYLFLEMCIRDRYEDGFYGEAQAEDRYGNQYKIRDIWKIENQLIRLDRTAACTRFTEETGIHLTTEFRVRGSRESSFDDYQFVIPGAFYNKNDTDGDGEEDYLGTYSQDYKDDRNPSKMCIRDRLEIKMADTEQLAVELSGGNQQKVVISKWLASNPKILIPVSYTHLDVYKRQQLFPLQ